MELFVNVLCIVYSHLLILYVIIFAFYLEGTGWGLLTPKQAAIYDLERFVSLSDRPVTRRAAVVCALKHRLLPAGQQNAQTTERSIEFHTCDHVH